MFDFSSIWHTGSFSLADVGIAMGVALVLGVVIALTYKSSHSHTSSFAVILVTLPVVESIIIMMVNGNLGASVVVLGAFGLIRFRSAPGSAWDIGFIFFSMAVGLAVGLGYITLAVVLTVVVCAIMFLLERLQFGMSSLREKQLRITVPEDLEFNHVFDDLFQTYARTHRLTRVKTTNMGTLFELTYILELKDLEKEKEFIDALRCRNGNLTVVLSPVLRNKDEL